MRLRLGILTSILAALVLGTVLASRTDDSSATTLTGYGDVMWGDANCDDSADTTDVLYLLSSFTHHQPATPASCPNIAASVTIDDGAYLWGDFNCTRVFDYSDVLFSLNNLAGINAGSAPQAISCYDWASIVSPYFPAPGDDSLDLLAIDTTIGGNAATVLGPRDTCREVAVGQTFDVDVVVRGIPGSPGLIAFDHDFRYNPGILQYVSNNPYFLIAANNGPSRTGITDYTDFGGFTIDINTGLPDPGTPNGHVYPSVYDYSYSAITPESGDGVLIRYTLKAISGGTSPLSLHQTLGNELYAPTVGGTDFKPYKVPNLRGAEIRVGTACPGATPTATASPTPATSTPMATATAPATPTPTTTEPPGTNDCLNENPVVGVPDNDPSGVTVQRTVGTTGVLDEVYVCLNINAQWVGDVVATLTHEETGTTRILVDRLGNHAGTCDGNGNGIFVLLTDYANPGLSMEDKCHDPGADEDIIGEFYPDQPLSSGPDIENTFYLEDIAGTWTLKVSDNAPGSTTSISGFELFFIEH